MRITVKRVGIKEAKSIVILVDTVPMLPRDASNFILTPSSSAPNGIFQANGRMDMTYLGTTRSFQFEPYTIESVNMDQLGALLRERIMEVKKWMIGEDFNAETVIDI